MKKLACEKLPETRENLKIKWEKLGVKKMCEKIVGKNMGKNRVNKISTLFHTQIEQDQD